MAKVAVTGGAGFIGSNLTRRLISEGYDVVIVDDLSTGLVSNIDEEKAEFHQISITDLKALSAAQRLPNYLSLSCPWLSASFNQKPCRNT